MVPSSDVVLTASYDGTARIWTTTANPVLSSLEVRDGEILDLPAGYSVHRAFYGDSSKHWDKSGGRDVAEKLRYLLSDDSRQKPLCVCSELFGEPLTKDGTVLLVEGACVEETTSPLP